MCMYVCMHIGIHACRQTCRDIHLCMYVNKTHITYIFTHICIHTCVNVCIYEDSYAGRLVCMYIHTYIYYMHANIHEYMSIHSTHLTYIVIDESIYAIWIYTFRYVYQQTHESMCTCEYVFIHICMFAGRPVCMYVYTHMGLSMCHRGVFSRTIKSLVCALGTDS